MGISKMSLSLSISRFFVSCRSAEYSLPMKKDLENLRIELRLANQKVKESSLFAESLTDEFERYKR